VTPLTCKTPAHTRDLCSVYSGIVFVDEADEEEMREFDDEEEKVGVGG
jgi:hypothetical protein